MASFSPGDLAAAIEDLAMCEFFPADEAARAAIMRLLARMVPSREALQWLVRQYVDRIGKWHGPMELRGVLCTRYKPADGVEAESALPGYRAEDSEARWLEEHEQLKAGWIEAPERSEQITSSPTELRLIQGLSRKKAL